MVIVERKSKFKHKVTFAPRWADSEHAPIKEWCEQKFGPGAKSKNGALGGQIRPAPITLKIVKTPVSFCLNGVLDL